MNCISCKLPGIAKWFELVSSLSYEHAQLRMDLTQVMNHMDSHDMVQIVLPVGTVIIREGYTCVRI